MALEQSAYATTFNEWQGLTLEKAVLTYAQIPSHMDNCTSYFQECDIAVLFARECISKPVRLRY